MVNKSKLLFSNKKVILVLILIVLAIFIYSLVSQIAHSLQASYRLDLETDKLVSLQEKNRLLKKKLEEVDSLTFIEEQARNKLNLTREGETVFIIPDKEIERVLGLDKKIEEVKLPNWQGWLKLFWK